MVLTNERAEMLAKYLTDKKEAGFDLLELDASEAVAKINAEGFDFTAEELHAFADMMEKSDFEGDELDETSLDNVSGGVAVAVAVVAFAYAYYVYTQKRRGRW